MPKKAPLPIAYFARKALQCDSPCAAAVQPVSALTSSTVGKFSLSLKIKAVMQNLDPDVTNLRLL